MIVYDERGTPYEVADDADEAAPMSAGHAIAALALLPFVLLWAADQWGIDVLAPLMRLAGGL